MTCGVTKSVGALPPSRPARATYRARRLYVCFLLVGCFGTSPALADEIITTSEPDGLDVLLSAHVGMRPPWWDRTSVDGRVFVASTEGEYDDLWDDLITSAERPVVDFSRRVVLAEIRHDDGCVEEVTHLSIGDRRVARLGLAYLTSFCIQPLNTAAHVVSLPRSRLGGGIVFTSHKDESLPVSNDHDGGSPRPRAAHAPTKPTPGPLLGSVQLPPRNTTEVAVLSNGQSVFVARHPDGSHTVLPTHLRRTRGLVGLSDMLYWAAGYGRFFVSARGHLRRAWDGRGTSVFGAAVANLVPYHSRARGDKAADVYANRVPQPQSAILAGGSAQNSAFPFSGKRAVPFDEARQHASGTMVVFDGRLVIYGDEPPRICAKSDRPTQRCPSGSPTVRDISVENAVDNHVYVLLGPLAARFDNETAYDVVYLGAGTTGRSLTDQSKEGWRMRFATEISGLGNGDGVYAGGMFSATTRQYRTDSRRNFKAQSILFGHAVGFDVRLRVLPGIHDDSIETLGTLGVAPFLPLRLGDHWATSSILDLAVPEAGWLVTTKRQGPFVSWSWDLTYRLAGTEALFRAESLWVSTDLDRTLWGFSLGVRD